MTGSMKSNSPDRSQNCCCESLEYRLAESVQSCHILWHAGHYFERDVKGQTELNDENGGHSIFKIPMFCLVTEIPHAQSTSQRPSQESEQKQRSLRDAPGAPDGSFFVYSHEGEPQKVDCYEINDEKFHMLSPAF